MKNNNIKIQERANKYVAEYLKCKQSFEYFCLHYVFLELPGKDILFKPYSKQLELTNLIEKVKHVIVLKSRQIGISTVVKAYIAWLTLFFDNAVVGIISKDGPEATDFARGVRVCIEKVPDWMKPKRGPLGPGFAKKSEQSYILTNGSKTYATTVNPKAPEKTLRGKAITFLVIDEAAFANKIDEAWTGIVPALSTAQMQARKARVPYGTIILSTPNKTLGVGKWFFNKYTNSVSGDGILKPFTIHWKEIPKLADDPHWYKTQCELLDNDKNKIAQELELKFLPSTGSFFKDDIMEKVQNACRKPIEKLKLFNGEVWKFTDPNPNKFYLIGVDTATEYGEDKSAITVWDYETLDQVWEYQGKCKVLDFVKVVKVAAAQYPGLIIVESNSCGNQVVEQIGDSDFSVMLYKEKTGEKTTKPGLTTSLKTRPLIIDALFSYVNQYPEIIKSERLALELSALISKKSSRVEADEGSHDDIAITAGLCFYVRKYDPPLFIDTHSSNQQADIAALINQNTETMTDISSTSIMHKVKEDIEKYSGFVDVMSMYNQE